MYTIYIDKDIYIYMYNPDEGAGADPQALPEVRQTHVVGPSARAFL